MKNKKLNEGRIKEALQDAIDRWYYGEDSTQIISDLTGLDIDLVNNILKNSSVEDAMENLMFHEYEYENENHNMKNILSFNKMFENELNENKKNIQEFVNKMESYKSIKERKKYLWELIKNNNISFIDFKELVEHIFNI